MARSDYIELHARSGFSFLRGASLPEQLAESARKSVVVISIAGRDGKHGNVVRLGSSTHYMGG